MKEIETKSWLIISCLLISGIALFVQSDISENLMSITDENVGRQEMDNDDSTHWNLAGTGDFNGSISGYTINEAGFAAGEIVTFANLPMDPTNRWYVMNNSATVSPFFFGSIDLLIDFSGQNMIEGSEYDLKYWLWSIDENGDMFRHTNYKALDIDLMTGQTSFTDNFSITMIDILDGNSTQVARPNGCYWVEYWMGQESPQTPGLILPGGKTDMVSFGIPCPTDDTDGDTWTDTQEIGFGSDKDDSTSTPWNEYLEYGDTRYFEGYAAACVTLEGTMVNGNCVIVNSCEGCPSPTNITDDDGDGVIDIFEDADCLETPENSYVNSTGCVEDITIDPTSEPSCPCGEEDGDVNLTGSGDAADLTVVGGAGLLAGIGASSIISQTGRGPRTSGGGNKKPDIDIDDVGDAFDNLDLDMDADLDMDRPKVATAKPQSMGGSDQYFKSGVERQKAMTDSADPLLDDYEEEVED